MRSAIAALVLCLVAAAAPARGSDDAPLAPLRFDPFSLPDLEAPAARDDQERDTSPRGDWAPVLQAILIGESASLVDLGGVVLRPGQATRGWQLIEVAPDEAVFLRDGQRVVLPLIEPAAGAGRTR